MLGQKSKRNHSGNLRKQFLNAGNMVSDRVSQGVKYAGDNLEHIIEALEKNENISYLNKRIKKHPTEGVMAAAGLGMIIYGLYKIFKK